MKRIAAKVVVARISAVLSGAERAAGQRRTRRKCMQKKACVKSNGVAASGWNNREIPVNSWCRTLGTGGIVRGILCVCSAEWWCDGVVWSPRIKLTFCGIDCACCVKAKCDRQPVLGKNKRKKAVNAEQGHMVTRKDRKKVDGND